MDVIDMNPDHSPLSRWYKMSLWSHTTLYTSLKCIVCVLPTFWQSA